MAKDNNNEDNVIRISDRADVARERHESPEYPALDNLEIGGAIQAQRLKHRMTETEVADYLSIDVEDLQNIEMGLHQIPISQLYRLASHFSVPLYKFFPGSEVLRPNEIEPSQLSYEMLELSRSFRSIEDVRVRQLVVAFVDSVANGDGSMTNLLKAAMDS